MARFAIKDLNKIAANDGLELVKGTGYFYWYPLDVAPSVYVNSFSEGEGDRDFWLDELKAAIEHKI